MKYQAPNERVMALVFVHGPGKSLDQGREFALLLCFGCSCRSECEVRSGNGKATKEIT